MAGELLPGNKTVRFSILFVRGWRDADALLKRDPLK